MNLAINTKAPEFSALDQDGRPHTLGEYQGRWLLLYFYPKDFTAGCTVEACSLRDNFGELKKKMDIVGVSADNIVSHQKFSQTYKLPFTILADPERKMIKSYGSDGLVFTKRTSFLINPEGLIAKIYEKVKPLHHAEEVLKDVQALSV